MKICAVICEYNPFHNGHAYQINQIKSNFDAVVCLMSGNFVQRATPAVCDKVFRAEQALQAGADLVLQLPTVYACGNATVFAKGALSILSHLPVDALCFGMETPDLSLLTQIADLQATPSFWEGVKQKMKAEKLGYADACAQLSAQLLPSKHQEVTSFLSKPNNVLALEYAKANRCLSQQLTLFPIERKGDYHGKDACESYLSSSAIRESLRVDNDDASKFVPNYAKLKEHAGYDETLFDNLALYAIRNQLFDKSLLSESGEGLENLLYKNALSSISLEECIQKTKSKRYTYGRIRRLILACLLGITKEYVRDFTHPRPILLGISHSFSPHFAPFSPFVLSSYKDAEAVQNDGWFLLEKRAELLYAQLRSCVPTGPITQPAKK